MRLQFFPHSSAEEARRQICELPLAPAKEQRAGGMVLEQEWKCYISTMRGTALQLFSYPGLSGENGTKKKSPRSSIFLFHWWAEPEFPLLVKCPLFEQPLNMIQLQGGGRWRIFSMPKTCLQAQELCSGEFRVVAGKLPPPTATSGLEPRRCMKPWL